jgi:tetratricopeptide (TPR) repeat protein
LYGSYKYNSAGDVLRAEVPAGKTDRFYETLTIDIDLIPNNAMIYISWGNEQTRFKVKTTTDERVMTHISEELQSDTEFPVYDYANAATYLSYQDLDLDLALEMAEKSVKTDPSKAYTHAIKIELLVKMGRKEEAKEAAILAKDITNKKSFSDEGERQAELAYYDTLLEALKD